MQNSAVSVQILPDFYMQVFTKGEILEKFLIFPKEQSKACGSSNCGDVILSNFSSEMCELLSDFSVTST